MRSLSEVRPEEDAHAHTDCGPDPDRDADRGPDPDPDPDRGPDPDPDADRGPDADPDRDCERYCHRDGDPYRDPHGVAERQCFSRSDGGIDGGGDQREPGQRS
jgi:hypothetical protein